MSHVKTNSDSKFGNPVISITVYRQIDICTCISFSHKKLCEKKQKYVQLHDKGTFYKCKFREK